MSEAIAMRDRLREEQREKNRLLMPNLAAIVDEFREHFPDCKLIYGKDLVTGREVGKPVELDPDKVFDIPANYFPTRTLEKTKKGKT